MMLRYFVCCLLVVGTTLGLSVSFSFNATAAEFPIFIGEEIIISASRIVQSKTRAPLKVTTITKKDIDAMGAINVGEALRYSAGVDLTSFGGGSGAIQAKIRGGTSQQTLVLINGARINSPLLGGADLSTIPTYNVEKIEIVKGPASSIYGADASSGVINIITEKAFRETIVFGSYQVGGSGLNRYSINYAGSLGKLSGSLGGEYLTYTGYRTNSDLKAQNVSTSLKYDLTKGTNIKAGLSTHFSTRGVPGATTFLTPTTRQGDYKVYSDADLTIKDIPNQKIKFSIANRAEHQAYQYPSFFVPTVFINEQYDSHISEILFSDRINLELSDLVKGSIIGGAEYRKNLGNSSISGIHTTYNTAYFMEKQISIGHEWDFIAGARADWHSVFGRAINPRVAINYHPKRNSVIRVSWNKAFRAPTLNELYLAGSGNPNLQAERANMYTLGYFKQINRIDSWGLDLFVHDMKSMIRWAPQPSNPFMWSPYNLANAQVIGAELELQKKIDENRIIFFNATYQSPVDTDTNKDITYTPRIKGNVGLKCKNNYANINWLFRYVGEQFTDAANTPANKLPAYLVSDVKLDRVVGTVNLSMQIKNLFGAFYQEYMSYPAPLREVVFGIEWSL